MMVNDASNRRMPLTVDDEKNVRIEFDVDTSIVVVADARVSSVCECEVDDLAGGFWGWYASV